MTQNAKDYNVRGSEVFEDAERMRKALSNLMREHNPAYKLIPNYNVVPTPIPGEEDEASDDIEDEDDEEEDDDDDEEDDEPAPATKRRGRPPKNPQAQRLSATPALSDYHYAGVGFEGLTFQKAQEKIVEDAIREKEIERCVFRLDLGIPMC